MVDFKPPIDKESFKNLKVEPIQEKKEQSKKDQEAWDALEQESKKSYLLYVFSCISSIFSKMIPKHLTETISQVENHLEKFKRSLMALAKEDLSQDPIFLKQISENWTHLLEESKKNSAQKFPLAILHTLTSEIASYPEKQEYSLGYYLSEFAGLQWIPFPYMEMLHDLHAEYQTNPSQSLLQKWITLIQDCQSKQVQEHIP